MRELPKTGVAIMAVATSLAMWVPGLGLAPLRAADLPKPGPKFPERKETVVITGGGGKAMGVQDGSANALLLKKYDLNGDGKIDEYEIAAAQKKLGTNQLARPVPIEGGHRVTVQDLYEGNLYGKRKTDPVGSGDDFIRKYDLNRDGSLDATEMEMIKRDLERGSAARRRYPAGTSNAPAVSPRPAAPLPPGTIR